MENLYPKVGDIVELQARTAIWAGFLYARVIHAFSDGDLFVVGKINGEDTFVGVGNYRKRT